MNLNAIQKFLWLMLLTSLETKQAITDVIHAFKEAWQRTEVVISDKGMNVKFSVKTFLNPLCNYVSFTYLDHSVEKSPVTRLG